VWPEYFPDVQFPEFLTLTIQEINKVHTTKARKSRSSGVV